jgi:hypothetical protein
MGRVEPLQTFSDDVRDGTKSIRNDTSLVILLMPPLEEIVSRPPFALDHSRLSGFRLLAVRRKASRGWRAIIDACYCGPTTQVSKMRIRGGLS